MKKEIQFLKRFGLMAAVAFAQSSTASDGQPEKAGHLKSEAAAIDAVSKTWGNGMEIRYYSLEGGVLEKLGLSAAQEPVHVEDKFPFASFPKGASAIYRPGLKKLFLENTPENLQISEMILADLGLAEEQASAEQVKIETRFVEFNEGALEELGVNWSDQVGGKSIGLNNQWALADGADLFTNALRSVPFSQTESLGSDSGLDEIRASGAWRANRIEDMFNVATNVGMLKLSGTLAGAGIDALIRVLDQTAGVDVLSAPSIVTLSGEPATITVGERHSYPETYTAGESQGTMVHVQYGDFAEKILGVEMTVTPVIKGGDIQMKINPKITDFLGFQQFELSPADTSYNYYQFHLGQIYKHNRVIAQLPLFNRREIKTEILVASGATIGLGGLIGEKKEAFSDRVPVLGSIPLIGRLFRSEGERVAKRNLMILVTASKVTPGGRTLSERKVE